MNILSSSLTSLNKKLKKIALYYNISVSYKVISSHNEKSLIEEKNSPCFARLPRHLIGKETCNLEYYRPGTCVLAVHRERSCQVV